MTTRGARAGARGGGANGRMNKSPGLLFDTGALIDLYRGRPVMQTYLRALLNQTRIGYISVISEAELWRGIKPGEVERHQAILASFTGLDLDSQMARVAGEWMQKYEAQGLGWMDALIAATAKQAGLKLLTRDVRLAKLLAPEIEFEVYQLNV